MKKVAYMIMSVENPNLKIFVHLLFKFLFFYVCLTTLISWYFCLNVLAKVFKLSKTGINVDGYSMLFN